MQILIIIAVIFVLIFLRRMIKSSPKICITLNDIPAIAESLKISGANASYAIFIFPEKAISNDEKAIDPAIQYSIENNELGFELLLNSEFNVKNEEKFIKITKDLGYAANKMEMNGVKYARIVGNDLERNGVKIIQQMYDVTEAQEIDVEMSGFTFKGRKY